MGHTVAEKQKLLRRVRRLKAQTDAVAAALEADADPAAVVDLLTAGRVTIDLLLSEVLADHVRLHVIAGAATAGATAGAAANVAADDLIDAMHAYICR